MLSESETWHANGTFHTKNKYFAQLYTIHAYFQPNKFDQHIPDRVWVKRMMAGICCFQLGRWTKDYVKILEIIIDKAQKLGCSL